MINMTEINPVLKKLQFKDHGQAVLIVNAPEEYREIMKSFSGDVDESPKLDAYDFVQVFGTTNEKLQSAAKIAVQQVTDDGLMWLCYPKKSSKTYKGSDCSRDTVAGMLSEEGYEPVRQVAIDEDWSALRFRPVGKIKKMVRDFAVTKEGIERTRKTEQ